MAWTVELSQSAAKDLAKLDALPRTRVLQFLNARLEECENPRAPGRALRGSEFGELWRYRVGDYRIIATLDDDRTRVLVLRIRHRREVYR